MLSVLKKIFRGKTEERQTTTGFEEDVLKAIALLSENTGELENEAVLNLFIANGINDARALKIHIFLPIAFVRVWLQEVSWPDSYIEFINEDRTREKKYAKSKAYQSILNVTLDYFAGSPDKDTVLKIAGRSAEFHVINQLLTEHPDYNISDVKFSKTVIPFLNE
jgi:hypothetical protein